VGHTRCTIQCQDISGAHHPLATVGAITVGLGAMPRAQFNRCVWDCLADWTRGGGVAFQAAASLGAEGTFGVGALAAQAAAHGLVPFLGAMTGGGRGTTPCPHGTSGAEAPPGSSSGRRPGRGRMGPGEARIRKARSLGRIGGRAMAERCLASGRGIARRRPASRASSLSIFGGWQFRVGFRGGDQLGFFCRAGKVSGEPERRFGLASRAGMLAEGNRPRKPRCAFRARQGFGRRHRPVSDGNVSADRPEDGRTRNFHRA